MTTILTIVLSLLGLFLLQLILDTRRVTRDVGYLSGPRFLFRIDTIPGLIMAWIARPARYLNMGVTWGLTKKYEDFAEAGQDAIAVVTAFPRPSSLIYLADPGAIKEVTSSRARFPKPVERYAALTVFGINIVASEGEEWKRYRKISAPAFSERNNKLVWDETIRIMDDLFDNVWVDKPQVEVEHFLDITVSIALFAISAAGFGQRITWTSDLVVPPGHKMTFKDALHILSSNLLVKIAVPGWAMNLTKNTRNVHLASMELKQYMLEMIESRGHANKVDKRHDLFNGLLDAAQDELNTGVAISEEELIGNMFIFLLAGHETTAHSLCFTFALLALYPDEQERLYQHIKTVTSSLDGPPAYEDMNRFTYTFAVFNESLRLFPAITLVPKIAAKDTTLTVNNADGGRTTFPIPAGTDLGLHVAGLHYNPRYWKDPHKFMPERFLGDWPKDAFISFSQGARACIGRRFSETEAIAVLNSIVSKYRFEVKDEPQFAGETFKERYARVTAFEQFITTSPIRVPLVFKRR